MTAFWIALLFVLMAEMGDKTQLVALAFATRFPTGTVLTGVFGATLVVHLFSVGIGEAAGLALPVFWIHLLAGLSFIVFGLWTLRGDTLAEEAHPRQARFGPLLEYVRDTCKNRSQRGYAAMTKSGLSCNGSGCVVISRKYCPNLLMCSVR